MPGIRRLLMAGDAVTTPADLVRDNAAQLRRLHPRLEYALTQASSGDDGGMAPRPADAPFPGDPAAFAALMVIWEAVPRLEASIRLAIAGYPGRRRGGDPRHFLAALESIVSLSGGLDEDGEALAARVLERLAGLARRVRAIDEAEQWRYVQARACPRCGCFSLKVLRDEAGNPGGRIECFGHTEAGPPCRATWARLVDIVPDLARADELAAQDLDG